jgi:ABC-type multidrug transport system ATPase subunit
MERVKEEGRTILLATRYGEVAAWTADRTLLLQGGRLSDERDADVLRTRLAGHDLAMDGRVPAQPSASTGTPGPPW